MIKWARNFPKCSIDIILSKREARYRKKQKKIKKEGVLGNGKTANHTL